jgi:ketosteroid isomerase-like protein
MSAFETAKSFFHACETLEGWQGCKQYVASGAPFRAQSEPLTDVTTVEGYTEWMAGLGKGPLQGCSYDLHSAAWDEANKTATFFATFHGRHVADGGPVAPTNKETKTDYVYVLTMNDDGKVARMVKIWNAPWALRELGWA